MSSHKAHGRAGRRGEKGAALVTALFISLLLLTAGGALILTTSLTATTAFDATAEAQAYYAAEAGIQDAMRVIRGNVAPSPLFASNPSGGIADANKISPRGVVTRSISNRAGESTSAPLRLSRWLPYSYTSPGSAYPDRVPVSSPYSPANGLAYGLSVTDPAYPTPAAIANKLATDAAYQPTRLLVVSTGYGPSGARKQLKALVRSTFWDIEPPSPIVIRGADDGSGMTFDLGSSSAKRYTGADNAGVEAQKPTVAIKLQDWNEAMTGITKGSTVASPQVGILDVDTVPSAASFNPAPAGGVAPSSVKTPSFLRTANDARAFVAEARQVAKEEGVYLGTSQSNFSMGSVSSPAFRFVDGSCELNGGAGLLIVTGNLVLKGQNDFNGIIIVMGNGNVTRSGGGNGSIYGAWIVARFGATGNFLAPTFDVSGGGNGDFVFDSEAIRRGNRAAGPRVLGVAEY